MTKSAQQYPLLFVGAGPGDPELITVKGQMAMAAADLVVYAGSLVPEALLRWAPNARAVNSASMNLGQIIDTMAAAVAAGQKVVRLHTGDPSLYGAIFEQMVELAKRGIAYKVIPGVTAAFAAAATLGLEYTLPEVTQTLILTRMAGRTPVPAGESLESLAAHQASMAIYLSIGMIDQLGTVLQKAYGENAPCAVVYRASHPDEKVLLTTARNLADAVHQAGIKRQALVIVGKVMTVGLEDLKWASKLYDPGFAHGFRATTASAPANHEP
jgi:precorrin-4/cobalt-precorrin-4 C11-methyltransferase